MSQDEQTPPDPPRLLHPESGVSLELRTVLEGARASEPNAQAIASLAARLALATGIPLADGGPVGGGEAGVPEMGASGGLGAGAAGGLGAGAAGGLGAGAAGGLGAGAAGGLGAGAAGGLGAGAAGGIAAANLGTVGKYVLLLLATVVTAGVMASRARAPGHEAPTVVRAPPSVAVPVMDAESEPSALPAEAPVEPALPPLVGSPSEQMGYAAVDTRGVSGPAKRPAARAVTTPPPPAEPPPVTADVRPADAAGLPAEAASTGTTASLDAEMALIREAQRALSGDPARALAAAESHAAAHPSGALAQEREVLAIHALAALGRSAEARARADAFATRWPGSAYLRRIEVVLGGG